MCSNKIRLFIDADDTILQSSAAIVNILNKKYNLSKSLDDIDDWGYRSISGNRATSAEIAALFESRDFFDIVEVDPGFDAFLAELGSKTKIAITTKGTKLNLLSKEHYFENKYIDSDITVIGLKLDTEDKNVYDKGMVDMAGGICIDDRIDCLRSCNASVKILLTNGKHKRWSDIEDAANIENLYIAKDWEDVTTLIEYIIKHPFMLEVLQCEH